MKGLLFFFFYTLGCFAIEAQEIHFDQIVKSKFSTRSFPDQEKTHYFNSKNKKYVAYIYKRADGMIFRIMDTEEQIMYNFYVQNTSSGTDLLFLDKKEFPEKQKAYKFEFTDLKSEDGFERLKLQIKGRGRRAKYLLSVERSTENHFHIFKHTATESYYGTDFQTPFPLKVVKAIGYYNHGKITYELVSVEPTNFSVILPE
jgi:hypothetical protein